MMPTNLGLVIRNERPVVSSRNVADVFERQHTHVLRDIRNLECSTEFTASNFGLSEYKDPTGRVLPEYFMTRDGFTFLAMGFTGSKAAQWKEAYINAFNEMEASLKGGSIEVFGRVSSLLSQAAKELSFMERAYGQLVTERYALQEKADQWEQVRRLVLQEQGIKPHSAIQANSASAHLVQEFIRECCERGSGARLRRADFYMHFIKWCKGRCACLPSQTVTSRIVNELALFKQGNSAGYRFWYDVKLK